MVVFDISIDYGVGYELYIRLTNCYTFVTAGLPNVTLGSSVQMSPGSTTILNCYVTSPTTVSSITWLYQKNGVNSVVNTGDTSKYSGGTVGTPSLTVKNVQVTDVGNYRCQAQNTAGIGQSASMVHLDLSQGLKIRDFLKMLTHRM